MWLVLALVSFVAFLVSGFTLTRLGFNREGKLQPSGKPLLLGTVVLLAMWVFSLSRVPPPYPLETLKRYEAPNTLSKFSKDRENGS
jgi:hypothetical protein